MEHHPKEAVRESTAQVNPIASQEGEEENMIAYNPEVVRNLSMSSTSLENTEAFKAIKSNMDYTVSAEAKSDIATLDISRTREFPKVLSDNKSDKENQREVFE